MSYVIDIPIRVTDLNYGNHLGYDKLAGILHQSRLQYLLSLNLQEANIDGFSMIMKKLEINYQGEGFLADTLHIKINFLLERAKCKAQYIITKNSNNYKVANAIETLVFMNYKTKKISRIPEIFIKSLR